MPITVTCRALGHQPADVAETLKESPFCWPTPHLETPVGQQNTDANSFQHISRSAFTADILSSILLQFYTYIATLISSSSQLNQPVLFYTSFYPPPHFTHFNPFAGNRQTTPHILLSVNLVLVLLICQRVSPWCTG